MHFNNLPLWPSLLDTRYKQRENFPPFISLFSRFISRGGEGLGINHFQLSDSFIVFSVEVNNLVDPTPNLSHRHRTKTKTNIKTKTKTKTKEFTLQREAEWKVRLQGNKRTTQKNLRKKLTNKQIVTGSRIEDSVTRWCIQIATLDL